MTTGPIQSGQIITEVQRFTPNAGDTINIANLDGDVYVILAPTAPISGLTINWPTTPYNGSTVTIVSTQLITNIVHTGNTLNLVFTTIKAGGSVNNVYDLGGLTYMNNGINTVNANSITITYSTTVTSAGNAFVYPTTTGTSSGVALFQSISAVSAFPTVANPNNACGAATVSGDLKTITIPCMTQTFNGITVVGIAVLGSNTIAATANGTAITVLVTGALTT